jgi:hypothetical protein
MSVAGMTNDKRGDDIQPRRKPPFARWIALDTPAVALAAPLAFVSSPLGNIRTRTSLGPISSFFARDS